MPESREGLPAELTAAMGNLESLDVLISQRSANGTSSASPALSWKDTPKLPPALPQSSMGNGLEGTRERSKQASTAETSPNAMQKQISQESAVDGAWASLENIGQQLWRAAPSEASPTAGAGEMPNADAWPGVAKGFSDTFQNAA